MSSSATTVYMHSSMRLAVRLKALPQIVSSASLTTPAVRERFRPPRPVACASRSHDRSARSCSFRPRAHGDVRARPPRVGAAAEHAPAAHRRARTAPMAATETNAGSRASTSPDIEDLFAKHPDVRSVIERAPETRRALLEWYDENHRVLPWRRNAHSKHCKPIDAIGTGSTARADALEDDHADKTRSNQLAKLYWRVDDHTCATRGAARDVPAEQYAYGVWVSEIMSQQTQIDRVATYWRRWMVKWPTVHALAEATQEEVNEMWAGLGYYRRARFLLEGARRVVAVEMNDSDRKDGKDVSFPRTSKALGGIPGVGPYTAAAVASIAFGEPVAAVDGNVIRVAARLAAARGGGDAAKSGTSAAAAVRAVADALLSRERPGDFNQAMMELGATVCAPRAPRCEACPVAAHCAGLALQTAETEAYAACQRYEKPFLVTDLPEKEKKAPKRVENVCVRVLEARVSVSRESGNESGDEEEHVGYLLTKRPEGGLLGGLWEFPSATAADSDDAMDETGQLASFCLEVAETTARATTGARSVDAKDAVDWTCIGAVTHVFSHVRQIMHVNTSAVRVALAPGSDPGEFFRSGGAGPGGTEWRWVRAGDVKSAGLSSGVLKVHALVSNPPAPKVLPLFRAPPEKPAKRDTAVGKLFAAAAKKRKTEP